MNKIEKLHNIANYLGLNNIVSELETIDIRSKQENANLILPLVGEFSSGKTTLINALTDSKKLETATKPTTATIYEVHFGCESCHAKIFAEDGSLQEVNDIATLKNDVLADAKVVTVFDTSKRVPSTTILVDTPGLSSPNPKHKQTLVNFLPKADGILLVTDINQGLTKSLTDFVKIMNLSKKPIYIIISQCKTKAQSEVDAQRRYIKENSDISVKDIICTSAKEDELQEFYALMDTIQKDKKRILQQVDNQRLNNIVNLLKERIDELMSSSSSDKDLDEAIRRCQYELNMISRNINRLVESMSDDISEQERTTARRFEDMIFTKLNSLVTGKSNNFDADAISTINSTAILLMNDYRNNIRSIIKEKAYSQKGTENEVPLNSLLDIDLSSCQISGLNYNLDLNTMGHEYDSWIKTGVIAVAAVGAVAAVAATGGAAAGAATIATADNIMDIADTVTDVGGIISNQKTISRMEKAVSFVTNAADKYQSINQTNQEMGQQMGNDKGLVESMVGFVTDKMMSKPQRTRAVRNYIDEYLSPEFKNGLSDISQYIVNSIRTTLHNEAAQMIGQKTESLNQLKMELKEKKDLFDQRMDQFCEFKNIL